MNLMEEKIPTTFWKPPFLALQNDLKIENSKRISVFSYNILEIYIERIF